MIDRDEEIRLITEFQMWPYFPILPVKNRDGKKFGEAGSWPKCACMMATLEEVKPIIYDFTIDTIPKNKEDIKILQAFNSFEELVDAGWVVD